MRLNLHWQKIEKSTFFPRHNYNMHLMSPRYLLVIDKYYSSSLVVFMTNATGKNGYIPG